MFRTEPFSAHDLQHLVDRLNRGDLNALWALVFGYRQRLASTLMCRHADLLAPGKEGHDAVMDAFVRLAERWPKVATTVSPRSIEGWLYKVVLNWNIDDWRRRKREREYIAEAQANGRASLMLGVSDETICKEMAESIEGFVATLDPNSRTLWEGSMHGGVTYAELAERTGMTKHQVHHQLQQIRGDLRQLLLALGLL